MLSCFKAYDIRGKADILANNNLPRHLGRALGSLEKAKSVVVGHDSRLSGPSLQNNLCNGLLDAGIEVSDLGLCGTEEIYYAVATKQFDLGIMITGSHNPADENGFKLIRRGGIPVSRDSGLLAIEDFVEKALQTTQPTTCTKGMFPPLQSISFRDEYIRFLLSYTGLADVAKSTMHTPLRVLVDAGNGAAGPLLERLTNVLPFDLVLLNAKPDGTFPNGVPNPLLPEKRAATAKAVREAHADFGVAFDGDFDRCFFYDNEGCFIEGYYCVGLLAEEQLRSYPHATIIHDPRVYWNTREMVLKAGGVPVMTKTGHAFMKERMRKENALYGGEMSAHHYFRDFSFCDSGMLPWLLMAAKLMRSGKSLAELFYERIQAYPCSGEINRRIADPTTLLQKIHACYAPKALYEDHIDGINFEMRDWRFNLRLSNTEPLVRLNVETRGNKALLKEKTEELLQRIDTLSV